MESNENICFITHIFHSSMINFKYWFNR